jgi:hypothetical protein
MNRKIDSHTILAEHCNIEYDKAGEEIVISSLAAVQIAMESYHLQKSKEEAQGRYEKAIDYINHGAKFEYNYSTEEALRIAAGIERKEEGCNVFTKTRNIKKTRYYS